MGRLCTAWSDPLERRSRCHICWEAQLLRRGLLGEACVDEGLGGSVSVESGSGCVTAGSGVCVVGHMCRSVLLCAYML